MSASRAHVNNVATPQASTAKQNNGVESRLQRTLHISEIVPERKLRTWGRWMKQPTTQPRWVSLVTHGALIATVLAGVISFGRASGRTEEALKAYRDVPQIQANVASVTSQLGEIKDLIQKQNLKSDETLAQQNRRIDAIQLAQTNGLVQLSDKINAIQGQMGSVWALAQSDSNKVSELKGMVSAMQSQMTQQHKER